MGTDIEREEFAGYLFKKDINTPTIYDPKIASQLLTDVFYHDTSLPDLMANLLIGDENAVENLVHHIKKNVVAYYEDHMQALLSHAWSDIERDKARR